MTTYERLEKLQAFVYERLCKGREMKTRGTDDDEVAYTEPQVFIGLIPRRILDKVPYSDSPGILIVPLPGYARNMEERFDQGEEERRFNRYLEKQRDTGTLRKQLSSRFGGESRSQDLGRTLPVQFVFSVYDSGIRGEAEPPDGDGDGLRTLLTWMDELEWELLDAADIGDLYVWDESIQSGLKTDGDVIMDTRPVWTGILSCTFGTLSHPKQNDRIQELLDN